MTPLAHVTRAAEYFKGGGETYKFDVPDDRVTVGYITRIRTHAKRLGYRWRVSHSIGQAWIIKQKGV